MERGSGGEILCLCYAFLFFNFLILFVLILFIICFSKIEYVDLYVHYLLGSSVSRQFDAFIAGFRAVCNSPAFDVFLPPIPSSSSFLFPLAYQPAL
jgi:HECT-domain (ubiquitin-transferase)